jgi:hypothetical protein
MSNNVLFYTQIISIVTFILALFAIYRLLIDQKDATIQLLKEKIAFLEKDIERYKSATPDILAERYSKRIDLLSAELSRLAKDNDKDTELINQKKADIVALTTEMESLRLQLIKAQETVNHYLCPFCGAPIERMEPPQRENDPDYFDGTGYYLYECGTEYVHDKLMVSCQFKP